MAEYKDYKPAADDKFCACCGVRFEYHENTMVFACPCAAKHCVECGCCRAHCKCEQDG